MTEMKIAIIIGHNRSAKGAYSNIPIFGLYQNEYDLHTYIASIWLQPALNAHSVDNRIFAREPAESKSEEIGAVYAKAYQWGCDVTVELHFNAGGGTGTETLCTHSRASKELAMEVQASMCDRYELPNRGVKYLLKSDRGGLNLYQLNVPSILTESFFGDHIDDCRRMNAIGPEAYAVGIANGIVKWCKLQAVKNSIEAERPKEPNRLKNLIDMAYELHESLEVAKTDIMHIRNELLQLQRDARES